MLNISILEMIWSGMSQPQCNTLREIEITTSKSKPNPTRCPLQSQILSGSLMVDVHSPEQRSRNMSRIRSTNTKPEMIVRSLVHHMGFRYRLHVKGLPGTPDLVFPAHRKIIFVHGCFWHIHRCRYGRVLPATNSEFWSNKRQGNVLRDRRNRRKLQNDGWSILVVWECWTRDVEGKLRPRLTAFLGEKK
jgi:DNA mismatch endonuclease (patch repair protein)